MSVSGEASADGPRDRGQQPMLAGQRAKQQNKNRTLRYQGGYFPLGYKAAVSQWWNSVTPAIAEHAVLSFIPYLQQPPTHTQTGNSPDPPTASSSTLNLDPKKAATPVRTNSPVDPYGPRMWTSEMVKLSGKNRAINEFSIERDGEEVEENLVILHGYGAGLGFFYKNFEGLSRVRGWKLYALDMLGMGRSSRPPFKIRAKDHQGKISEAENWFIDSLEEWRAIRKIEKFTLLGHSMGGYMAVAYALKYPGHLKKIILASPVGIPEDPYAVTADMPSEEPEESTLGNEFLQDQEATSISSQNNASTYSNAQNNKADNKSSAPKRPIPKWVSYLWDANISPFSIVRWTGPLGPRFVSGWSSRRFSHLPENEAQALHEYVYSLFRQSGSGEYALAYILAPGAFARSPLIRRIQGVGRQVIPSKSSGDEGVRQESREHGIPVVFMYGENDWMDVAGGYAAEQKLKEEKEKTLKSATPEEREMDHGSAKVIIIQKAGHHVYLDGPDQFNQVVREEMEATGRETKKGNASSV
ncbi:MAG: hypothetical protein M1818_006285 [Claussenomyces sp. TS43310]|nr:MAG: hypothetical protein M1818_006285 [Claussenomyces sp. TS43310]